MRERSPRPLGGGAGSPPWPEPDRVDLDRLGDREPTRGGAFGERFALGTAQFELPPSQGTVRGSADEPLARIMTRKVVCARPEMDASYLRERLLERGVSGAPVVDDWGRVVGVVSRTDLLEHEVTSLRQGKTVADIMMPLVFTLQPEAPIGQAAALMAYEGVHRIVVVDGSGCVVGVVTSLDISRWLGWCAGYPVGREP
ncbi:MAG TPA: CBS domain-containing protein [Kofleriaceae bacterium]|nr:CBS domain-containing protein [Kofleriaceae bacterium]